MSINEADLEQCCLTWFANLDYEVLEADNLDPTTVYDERTSLEDVVLAGRLRIALGAINPDVADDVLDEAVRRILRRDWPTLEQNNLAFHRMLTSGLELEAASAEGGVRGVRVQFVDFEQPERNDWVVCNQVEVVDRASGTGQKRRPDIVVFVNGLPLAVLELKNPGSASADIWDAYNQIQTYKRDVPSLFASNEVLVVSDDVLSRVGSLTAGRSRFAPWRAAEHERDILPSEQAQVLEQGERLEKLITGVFEHERFLDLVRNFITFETADGKPVKILAAYHQFHAVRAALHHTVEALATRSRRIGVVWHTQGSGKSLTMLFYVRKLVLDARLQNPTIVVLTDRNDLDNQLFGTFSRSQELLRQEPVQAKDRKHLRELLRTASGGVYFTTIQKFLPDETDGGVELTARDNVIVIADEAHRSQYGLRAQVDKGTGEVTFGLAKHMRDALPNAAFIGFTGTPIELSDKNTLEVFGPYISKYDIQRAVEDRATVPIYYEGRVAKLQLDENKRPHIDAQFEEVTEGEEDRVKEKLKSEWSSIEALVGSEDRIAQVAHDVVEHFERRRDAMAGGKAMLVCMSRRICVAMHDAIGKLRPAWVASDDDDGIVKVVMTGSASDGPEWAQHIRSKERLNGLAERFKRPDDPFAIVIVRDMWLTGFDAPCLHTLYVDKPMRGHNLMQAIARVNRVFGDKPGGRVVDYLGIAPFLKEALRTYTESGGAGSPTYDNEKAWEEFFDKLGVCRTLFHGFDTEKFFVGDSAQRLSVLAAAREHILRKRAAQKATPLASKSAPSDDYELFFKVVTELSKLAGLVAADDRFDSVRVEVAFYQAVKAGLVKLSPGKARATNDLQHAVRQIVANALVSDQVIDVFEAAGLDKPDISVLSPEFLAEVAGMKHKNLAAALLERILRDQIRLRRKDSVIQARSFEELLEQAVQRYLNRSIEVAEVIQKLLELAQEIRESAAKAAALGLTREEYAFYEALADNASAREVMGDKILAAMAHDLTALVRANATLDWDKKGAVQAKLRVLVKQLLRKYKYPPDGELSAISTVLEQAKTLGINIVEGAPSTPAREDAEPSDIEPPPAPRHELPYPLAVFEAMVLSHESKTLQVKTMVDAVERALAFTAICTFAYLRAGNGGAPSAELLAILQAYAGKPVSMGAWLELAVKSAKLVAADDGHPIARASRAFLNEQRKESALTARIRQEVIPYRNTFSHGVTADEAQVIEHEAPIRQAWLDLLLALEPLRALELVSLASIVELQDDNRRYKLRAHQGSTDRFPVVERTLRANLAGSWAYLLPPNDAPPLSLAPYMACDYAKDTGRREMMIARIIALEPGQKVDMMGVASDAKTKLESPR